MKDFSFLETAKGVVPYYEHQQDSANSLCVWSAFLFDMGAKLRSGGSQGQAEKYNALKQAYINLRNSLSQTHIFEVENNRLLQVVKNQHKENQDLKKRIKQLEAQLEFN